MSTEAVLEEAEFNRKVRSYWLLSGTIVCIVTVFGIVLLPIWLIVGNYITERYLKNMSCVLTDRSLKVGKGILVRQEKTVPLDKITDLGIVEGPIMRYLDLQALKVETAGGSSPGALVQLVGVVDARGFRDRVLQQRDRVAAAALPNAAAPALPAAPADNGVLVEIRDALLRIEKKLPDA